MYVEKYVSKDAKVKLIDSICHNAFPFHSVSDVFVLLRMHAWLNIYVLK